MVATTGNLAAQFLAVSALLFWPAVSMPAVPQDRLQPESSLIPRLETGHHVSDILGLSVSSDGKWLATGSYDQTVRIWSAATLEPVRTIRMPVGKDLEGAVYTVAFSPDGKTVAAAGRTGAWENTNGPWCVYLIDVMGGDIQTICDLPAGTNRVAYSRDGAYLAVANKCERPPLKSEKCPGRASVRVYRMADKSPVLNDAADDDVLWVEFNASGTLVATALDGKLRLYDKQNDGSYGLTKSISLPDGRNPSMASFSPDGSELAVAYASPEADDPRWPVRIDIFLSADLSFRFQPDIRSVDNGALTSVAWSSDDHGALYLYASGTWQRGNQHPILRWAEAGRGRPQTIATTPARILEMRRMAGGRIAFVGGLNIGVIGADAPMIEPRRPQAADFTYLGDHFAASRDGTSVQFAFEPSGSKPAHFSFSRRLLRMGEAPADAGLTPPIVDHPDLDLRGCDGSYRPTLNGKPIDIRTGDYVSTMAIAPKKKTFVLGSSWYVYHFDENGKLLWKTPIRGRVRALIITQDERLVIAALSDGTLRWYVLGDNKREDNKGGQELVALFASPNDERWVAWTPSGYYMASVGGDRLIGYQVNRGRDHTADFFTISRFQEQYRRPDIVTHALATLDEAKAIQFANLEAGRTGNVTKITDLLPPVIEILDPTEGSELGGRGIVVRYRIRAPSSEPVTEIEAICDDGIHCGIFSPPPLSSSGEGEGKAAILMTPQKEVVLYARNRLAAISEAARVHIRRTTPVVDALPSPKKVYVLAIGTNVSDDARLPKLIFAEKDAIDFANVLKLQEGKAFDKVFLKVLAEQTEHKATLASVRAGLEWLKQSVTKDDLGVVFLAGHGIDERGKFYYLTQDADLDRLQDTALSGGELLTALRAVKEAARYTALFIDTCHAAAVVGRPNSSLMDIEGVVSPLTIQDDIDVFASSMGNENSVEYPGYENGTFTKVMVEGIKGKARLQNQPRITTSMLEVHVRQWLGRYTSNLQTPIIVNVSDILIALVTP